MAVDMFLKLGDIKGEVEDATHDEEVKVLAWSWGMKQTGTTHLGAGGGAGRVSVHDLEISKLVDAASPNLALAACNGTHYPKALLTIRKAGKTPVEYLKINMEKVMVSSVETGSSPENELMQEKITLNFAKFKIEYTPQKADGTGGAVVEAGWDIARNE